MVGGLQHSYGYAYELPDFPQTSGVGSDPTPEAAGFFNPMELGQNGSIPQQQNPYPCPRIGSSAAAFYATEAYMGLSRYDLQENNTTTFNNFDQHEPPSYLHTRMPRNQFIRPNIVSYRNDHHPFSRLLSENEHLLILKEELLGDIDDTNMISPSPPFVPNQDLRASQYVGNMNQFEQQAAYVSTASCNNPGSHIGVSSSKTRIRWSQELHDRFVDCVNRLGGPEKARPKAILQLMDTEGLTIFHIKSHLQKFRNVKYVPESVEVEGRSNKRTNANNVAQIDMKTGLQIKEALQLQIDVQMRLHEQLQIQKNLQLSIEEQGKKLKMMLDQQQKTAQNYLMESTNSNTKSTLEEEGEEEDHQEEVDDNGYPNKIN